MSTLEWVTIVVVLVLILGWYLSYSAARLDRLHTRVESTSAALDAQLVRRAEATLEVANAGHLDAASGLILASAAAESLATVEGDPDREAVESDLTDALHAALSPITIDALRAIDEPTSESLTRIADAGIRVQMARRFHNDAVIDVRRVRRKTVVRLFRLAGHAALSPITIDALRAIDAPTSESLTRIADAGVRVQMARRFHNDAVIDVRRVRRKTVVRVFRLAGHAELPATIEFDDELPPSLRG